MRRQIRIGIVGDYNPGFHCHPNTNWAIQDAADRAGVGLDLEWVPTPEAAGGAAEDRLAGYDGLWLSAGSPYRSVEGALAAVEFARRRGRPFAGT